MFGLALTVVVAQAGCYGGLEAPRAPSFEAIAARHFPLWKTPEGTDLEGVDNYQKDRVRTFEAVKALLLDFKQHPEALEELAAAKRSGLERLDGFVRRLPPTSQLHAVVGERRAKVVEELGELAAFTRDLGALKLETLEKLTRSDKLADPLEGVLPPSLHDALRKYEAGWTLSPLLGWYGQQLSNSVAPVGPEAEALRVEHCQQLSDELLWYHDRWRELAAGLTLEQLVKLAALVPAIERTDEERWCGSSVDPSVTFDASGFHEIAIRRYDGCMDKWTRGVFGLTRGTRDPMTRRPAGPVWAPMINAVRAKVGAPPVPCDTW
ncbi:MAG: hypothetical protein U0228_09945 [Myxococcaceae bacterium]